MTAPLSRAVSGGLPPSAELQHDLAKVRYLLATLERLPFGGSEDFEDIAWLRNRHRFLAKVLASRAAMRQQKIVDFARWRGGGSERDALVAHIA